MARENILIVDDEKDVRKTICEFLEGEGYKPVEARGGYQAEERTKKEVPNLALIDLKMPGMAGGETAQLLLKNPNTKNIPIIFLTSIISEREERERLGEIGGRLFVAKPLDMRKVFGGNRESPKPIGTCKIVDQIKEFLKG